MDRLRASTNEDPNETIFPSLRARFATALTKGIPRCKSLSDKSKETIDIDFKTHVRLSEVRIICDSRRIATVVGYVTVIQTKSVLSNCDSCSLETVFHERRRQVDTVSKCLVKVVDQVE